MMTGEAIANLSLLFAGAGVCVNIYVITRYNVNKARLAIITWRDDYWIYFFSQAGLSGHSPHWFMTNRLGLSEDDAKIFIRYQRYWLLEVAISTVFVACIYGWAMPHLTK
jgi:hypothetical protein